jgi:phospholipid transport system substrate-binding protein
MKKFLVSVLLAATLTVSQAAVAGNAAGAKSFVDSLATQVLALVKDSGVTASDKKSKIESIFSDKVDIDFVAKFVLGKHWRAATPEQQASYVAAYRPFILKNYASKLTKYSGQTYTLKNARTDGDTNVVTMVITDPNGQNVNVDYKLKGDSAFKIVDIAVEGVSLLTTQRSEFNGIVERKGLDGLIGALNKQVASK